MANVGTNTQGKVLTARGVTTNSGFLDIGSLSGLTDNGVIIGGGNDAFTASVAGTNGQVLIGSTGAAPAFGTITSPDGSVTVGLGPNTLTLVVNGGTTVGKTITGDSGGAISPSAGNWNIVSDANYNTLVGVGVLTGSGSTLTLNLTRALSSPSPIGDVARNTALFTSLGSNAGQTFSVAANTYPSTSTTISSTAYSSANQALQLNIQGVVPASIAAGFGVALQMQGQDTSGNIVAIGSVTSVMDVVTVGATSSHVNIGSFLNGVSSVTLQAYNNYAAFPKGQVVAVTTPGAYPYTTLSTDYVILVDSSAARTITPMASPTTGQVYVIKDNAGSAATNAITITPSGKNIDGLASRTINSNYGSVTIVYNGTQWNII